MANAKICDKCGKINPFTGTKDLEIHHYVLTKFSINDEDIGFDICKDCEKELLDWLKFTKEIKNADGPCRLIKKGE